MDLLDMSKADVMQWAIHELKDVFDKVTVGAAIIRINKGTKTILLLKRNPDEPYFPGVFEIPGGKVDSKDKSINSAIFREVAEETGMEVIGITAALPRMIYTTVKMALEAKGKKSKVIRHAVQLNYVVVVDDEATCTVNVDEHSEAVWAHLAALEDLPMTDEMRELVTTALGAAAVAGNYDVESLPIVLK